MRSPSWREATARALTALRREPKLADRLNRTGRLLGDDRRLPGEDLAGGGLGVDGVRLATPMAEMGVRLVDLHNPHTGLQEEPSQAGAVTARGLHANRGDRAVATEPDEELLVAGLGRGERSLAEASSRAIAGGRVMHLRMTIHPADHRSFVTGRHTVLRHWQAGREASGRNRHGARIGACS